MTYVSSPMHSSSATPYRRGYGVIALLFLLIVALVVWKSQRDLEAARQDYRQESHQKAALVAEHMEQKLALLYQGIRTISFLPSVQAIDRYGENLDANAQAAIQEIYHNMTSNIAVSEIYIVPESLDPEAIDPRTQELQVPILMYDGAIASEESEEEPASLPVVSVEQALHVDEVEIHEYRLLQKQIAYFREHTPTKSKIEGLHVPMIAGEEVLTCDNATYEQTKRDADRTGLVFSVPFFDPNGVLKGTITAVIRNEVLQSMLPPKHYGLVNTGYAYHLPSQEAGQQSDSAAWVQKAMPDPALIFSEVVPVHTPDPRHTWQLWAGTPDAAFFESGNVKNIYYFQWAGVGFAALLALIGAMVLRMLGHQEQARVQADALRRDAMLAMADQLESSVQEVITKIGSAATQMESGSKQVSAIASDTQERSERVVSASHQAAETSSQVVAAAEELNSSIREISVQTHLSSDVAHDAAARAGEARDLIGVLAERSNRVHTVIGVIGGIAEKINLLALNATIESARAGEAGKGFSVVANEVKGLANQVQRATSEISAQVAEMQGATQQSVASVMEILNIIDRLSGNAAGIASAVEEQTAVTNEIANAIARTAQGAQAISQNIGSVQEGAQRTGITANEVLQSAETLAEQAKILRQKLDDFLRMVRE